MFEHSDVSSASARPQRRRRSQRIGPRLQPAPCHTHGTSFTHPRSPTRSTGTCAGQRERPASLRHQTAACRAPRCPDARYSAATLVPSVPRRACCRSGAIVSANTSNSAGSDERCCTSATTAPCVLGSPKTLSSAASPGRPALPSGSTWSTNVVPSRRPRLQAKDAIAPRALAS